MKTFRMVLLFVFAIVLGGIFYFIGGPVCMVLGTLCLIWSHNIEHH
jgi:hypothetical protein